MTASSHIPNLLKASYSAGRHIMASSGTAGIGRRSHATKAHLHEYFVTVSDQPFANRAQVTKSELVSSFCTFSGECLSSGDSGQEPRVVGNAFACLAPSVEGVKELMKSSVYNEKDIWDLSSAVISPLLTVHSSNLDAIKTAANVFTPPPGEMERLVILPDRPNVLARRVEIRPRHSPNFVRLHDAGYVSWAGPIFEEHVDADISKRPFKGSVMVVNDNTWDGFMKNVQSDIFVKERIWDLEKALFIPFRTQMRRME